MGRPHRAGRAAPVLRALGQATAKVHCVADADITRFAAAYPATTREDHRRFVDAFRAGGIPGVSVT